MRNPLGGRRLRPWRVALAIGGSIALVLAGSPLSAQAGTTAAQTIVCPSVADKLPEVPARARAEVDRNLALLQTQIQEANNRLARSAGEGGPNFIQNAILGPLADKRVATLDRIAIAIGRVAQRPTGLNAFATCTLTNSGDNSGDNNGDGDGQGDGDNPAEGFGPFPEDFIDIRQVQPGQSNIGTFGRFGNNGSRGTFVSQCGRNENRHNNTANFIVAPGVEDGAHHLHDYVGNLSTDGFSTDESLAAAGTTCQRGDLSTYFWPVLRDRTSNENANDPEGNVGQVLTARSVRLQFGGNATSKVVAMPRFLRLIMGDAKAATNGGANARAAWTCTGFQNRITPNKYPLCPRGSLVVRILDFPSCWDGQNTDSANHRTHVVFPGQNGGCPQGTQAIPQLRMTLTYAVPQGQSFAVDAFPEQKHNPVTDHADFANVMPDNLMRFVVDCINRGRRC
ncbi:DUF1996 domain-containing protein [Nonomuraea sp. NPDC050022]|uniref:DUF1996 domain-containing protein n=1 Tax=Nonomuraea sp. NPDC050022 TaxID=3364358 RepID=UPI00379B7556